MSGIPCGGQFLQSTVVVLQVNYWKKVGFPIQTPIFGDQSAHTDGCRWCHSGHGGADGSTPCGSAPPTPRIAFSKWKLVILQVNYPPKVPIFWVFPYKTGIESRKSVTIHRTHMGKVIQQFMYVR